MIDDKLTKSKINKEIYDYQIVGEFNTQDLTVHIKPYIGIESVKMSFIIN